MFEELFDNIFVLIPVAIVIGVRILSARQKRQAEAAKSSPAAESPGGSFSSSEAPERAALNTSQPAVHSPPLKPVQKTAEAPKAAAGGGAAFPQNLEYLPPLKRALVLSEILGPPKGFIK
jgi:hypothetical protein